MPPWKPPMPGWKPKASSLKPHVPPGRRNICWKCQPESRIYAVMEAWSDITTAPNPERLSKLEDLSWKRPSGLPWREGANHCSRFPDTLVLYWHVISQASTRLQRVEYQPYTCLTSRSIRHNTDLRKGPLLASRPPYRSNRPQTPTLAGCWQSWHPLHRRRLVPVAGCSSLGSEVLACASPCCHGACRLHDSAKQGRWIRWQKVNRNWIQAHKRLKRRYLLGQNKTSKFWTETESKHKNRWCGCI